VDGVREDYFEGILTSKTCNFYSLWRLLLLGCSGAEVTDCGNYLIVLPQQECRDNMVYFADLVDRTNQEWVEGTIDLDASYY